MKVGFTGLGIMGGPMTRNLLRAGYELVVNDFNGDAMADVVSRDAAAASSEAEAASQYEAIITVVPSSPYMRTTALGEGGIAEGTKSGTVLIDMSSIDPTESKVIGAELARKGIGMMDCPVSGGESETIGGTLSMMCGGKKELFDKYYDILIVMAGSVVCVSELGSGDVAGLANQIVVAVNIAMVSEALTFAEKAETDLELVYQAIRGSLVGSMVTDAKASMVLTGNFRPGFRTKLHIKDLNDTLNTAHAISSPVPLIGQPVEIMQDLKADGSEKEDHSSIVKYYGKTANAMVES